MQHDALQDIQAAIAREDYNAAHALIRTAMTIETDQAHYEVLRLIGRRLDAGRPAAALAVIEDMLAGRRPAGTTTPHIKRLALALVAFLLAAAVFVGMLMVFTDVFEDDPVTFKDFDAAAQALDIEPVAEWPLTQTDEFSLRVPARFTVFDETQSEQLLGVGWQVMGLDQDTVSELSQSSEQRLKLLVYDLRGARIGSPPAMIMVTWLRGSAGATLQTARQNVHRMVPLGFKIRESRIIPGGDQQALRTVTKGEMFSTDLQLVLYTFMAHNDYWLVYGICTSDCANWLPVIEASAQTFNPGP